MKTKEEIIFDTVNKHSQTDASFYKYESIDKFREELEEDSDLKLFLEMMDEYANQDKWISVKTRLPEIGDEVAVYCPNCKTKVTALARFIRYEGATGFFWDNHYGGNNLHVQDAITHWQELPKPPIQ